MGWGVLTASQFIRFQVATDGYIKYAILHTINMYVTIVGRGFYVRLKEKGSVDNINS